MKKVPPLKPTKIEIVRVLVYWLVCATLWLSLICASIHLVIYYIHQIINQGLYDQESMKIGVYVIIGTFLFLFIYRDHVKRIFKVKGVR